MLSRVWRCAARALQCWNRGRASVLALAIAGLAVAGCDINGQPMGPLAAGRTATIAIESIEGPPQAVTRRLAIDLGEEAETRKLVIVSGDEAAQYRLRGYLSTHVEHGKSSIVWVWDMYGNDKRRALRITGEEQSANDSHDAWAAVNEGVLRKIARSGMDRILVYLNSTDATDFSAETTGSAGDPEPNPPIMHASLPPKS